MTNQLTLKRALLTLCIGALSGVGPTMAHEAVLCAEEHAELLAAYERERATEEGSLLRDLASATTLEAWEAQTECLTRQEGLCGQVGEMLFQYQYGALDPSSGKTLTLSQVLELDQLQHRCIHTGQPDG